MKMSISLDVNSMASRHVSFLNLEFDVFIFLNLISFFLNKHYVLSKKKLPVKDVTIM
ncbi:hypothetical protein HanPI659440_Chr10g0379451 [Helianthus annuus]|uniref:Uncharacterized protein n=1 Tax=Helianthus annuus TaxID=4232 RepID=A0A251TK36_HELAN|nr:hypothetical protein HanIR_Chr10g0475491 [Helianthus annuus]KAJ0743742.1 hypothetical protein HanPI659440_Chr10g0379451 [Helianthus annuus]